MKNTKQSAVFLFAVFALAGTVRAQFPQLDKWRGLEAQKCPVVDCNSPSPSVSAPANSSEGAEHKAPDATDARYDKINKDANLAWRSATEASSFAAQQDGYYAALDLFRQQQALRDGPNVREAIDQLEALSLWVKGAIDERNGNYHQALNSLWKAYKRRPDLFNEANFNYLRSVNRKAADLDNEKNMPAIIAAGEGAREDGKLTVAVMQEMANTDTHVVDLRDAKTLTVDPSKVKGFYTGRRTPFTATSLESTIRAMNALARTLGWSVKKQGRLAKALDALSEDGTTGATVGDSYETWKNMKARENDIWLSRVAARTGGVGFPGAGTQTTNDCTIFALANAAGLPYGVAAARATKLIAEAEWRDPADRSNPERVFRKGLNGLEVLMLAESFGQAEVVPSSRFSAKLTQGSPILLGVLFTLKQPDNKYSQFYHEVVLTKTFQYKGETYFEMMDSNQPPTVRHYLTEKELGAIMFENGIAFHPEPRTTPRLLR